MAGAASGGGLLEGRLKCGPIPGGRRILQAAQAGEHIRIGRRETPWIGPDGGARARIAFPTIWREKRGQAFEKTDHLSRRGHGRAGISTLIKQGFDPVHVMPGCLQPISPG
jgi:hypothetical protein